MQRKHHIDLSPLEQAPQRLDLAQVGGERDESLRGGRRGVGWDGWGTDVGGEEYNVRVKGEEGGEEALADEAAARREEEVRGLNEQRRRREGKTDPAPVTRTVW